jgi:hypothetical protein
MMYIKNEICAKIGPLSNWVGFDFNRKSNSIVFLVYSSDEL